jgi:predicted DCC family thiol-disulfide oxidoreductase YuxK
MNAEPSIVLYDGVCGFCNSSVQFIIKRDPSKRFKFAPLQSEIGKSLAATHGYDPEQIDGLILIEDGKAYWKSSAALQIAKRINWPWPVFAALLIVPRVVRDWFYDQFAKRRYRWFGKLDECAVPSEADRARFLD